MLDTLLDVVVDALIDSAKVLPFLFGVYLLIEYIEHRSADKLGKALQKMGPFGAVGGGILGAVPQCGFSVVASNLYTGRLISMGTLVAVYLSTSDEAVPMMISNPEFASELWKLILIKAAVGIIAGIIVDLCLRAMGRHQHDEPFVDLCEDCDCEHHGIVHSALHHTIHIIIFILAVNLILGCVMEFAGVDAVKKIMMTDSVFQPFIAGIVGFIPNCAASVVLTQLYIEGVVSFGALISGLCTGAGVGLLVLFKTNKHVKENLSIMGILYIAAIAAGFVSNLIVK
ncbi:MAG: putative manganese transporter [Ruminococcus sp.]|nr:putative manganese transporter [Ruminococcus sp.]